jgi:hypothetical protein
LKEPDTGTGSAAAPRLSFGGQTELNTMIQVDGADNIQTYTGLPRATPSQEAAREFRILNSTYLAEYGRSLGGFVNIVTKSGTNDLHGSVYYFGMNDRLNARSILNSPDAAVLRQNQFGVTVGGPVQRDRTFFFGNYEGQRRAESNRFSRVVLDNLAALNAMRARFNLRPEVGNQLRTNDYDQFLVKMDRQLTEKHNVSLRYNLLDSETHNFLGGGGRASPASSTARDNTIRDQAFVANGISILSATIVNEARFQWAKRRFDLPSVLKDPDMDVPNLLNTGKSTSDVDYYAERRIQVADNLSISLRGHQIKAGFEINDIHDRARWDLFFPASIIFPNLSSMLSFSPSSTSGPVVFWWPELSTAPSHPGFNVPFTTTVPAEWREASFHTINHAAYGFFAQDQWNVASKWVLNYGVRYDFETYPRKHLVEKDMNNVQARVGVAYSYGNGGVLRMGYGTFHDRLVGSIGQLLTRGEWSSRGDLPNAPLLFPDVARVPGRFLQKNVLGAAATPAAINFLTAGTVPVSGITTLSANTNAALRTPYSHQASLQVSQELGWDTAVSASYQWVKGSMLPSHTPNINAVQSGVLPWGKPIIAGRRFADLGTFIVVDNVGSSTYHSGTLEASRRFNRGIAFHATYTYSKTITNADSTASLSDIPEGLDGRLERSLSRQHLGHRFSLAFVGQAPERLAALRKFRLSSSVSLESGRPFNVFAGSDANGDGIPLSDRPGLLGRNTWIGPGYASVDVRIARDVRMSERWTGQFSVDFFNVFNRVNVKDLNTVWGSADPNATPISSFNTPRDVFNPRQIQFGARLVF